MHGWLGPEPTPQEAESRLGPPFVPAKRFSVCQKEKAALALLDLPPRLIAVAVGPKPPWIFADAAVEDADTGKQSASIGGVLFESGSQSLVSFFSSVVPDGVMEKWRRDAPTQPICQAETFAVLVGKLLWKENVTKKKVIPFSLDYEYQCTP
eukprot:6492001-Amphidinium_carterae.1